MPDMIGMSTMNNAKPWAAEALEDFPEELRERAIAYLKDQGEKFRVLKQLVQEGIDAADAGRVSEWNMAEFMAEIEAEELAKNNKN
jgi:hypothetical protein